MSYGDQGAFFALYCCYLVVSRVEKVSLIRVAAQAARYFFVGKTLISKPKSVTRTSTVYLLSSSLLWYTSSMYTIVIT
jgi:hypothetical protein